MAAAPTTKEGLQAVLDSLQGKLGQSGNQSGHLEPDPSSPSGWHIVIDESAPAAPTAATDTGKPVAQPPTNIEDAFGGPTELEESPTAAMQGLMGAGPSSGPGFISRVGPGALNPRLGQRIYPNEMASLRALTY